MEESVHRFVRLLRRSGVRVGVSEAVDAMRALSAPGIAADRALTRSALRVSLIKDRRDEGIFDRIFDLFFRLRPVLDTDPAATGTRTTTCPTRAAWTGSACPRTPGTRRRKVTHTASRPTSGSISTTRTWPPGTTSIRRRTGSTWPP